MLKDIREQFKGKFTLEQVNELEKMENELLHFSQFNSEMALEIGNKIVECSKEYNEDVVVRIIRQSDDLIIFQYAGNTMKERNYSFAMGKYNTVKKTKHCSLWALAHDGVYGNLDDVYQEDSGCLPAAGAFPIFVNDEMMAIITTSGLHNGNDYEVVARALAQYENKKIPEYSGIRV